MNSALNRNNTWIYRSFSANLSIALEMSKQKPFLWTFKHFPHLSDGKFVVFDDFIGIFIICTNDFPTIVASKEDYSIEGNQLHQHIYNQVNS